MNNWRGTTFTIPLLLAIWAAVTGCGPNYIFQKEYKINEGAWTYSDTIDFRVSISDTLAIYNLYLEIEHSTEYSFQNLYTNIYTKFPNGQRLQKLVSLELANRGGIWEGDCSSQFCTLNIPIQQGAFFNEIGEYVITLEQQMRVDPIPGVRSFALKIEDTGERRPL